MSTVHLNATATHPEWTKGELHLWSADLVLIYGKPADIRALLARALDLIPTLKGEDQ